ncbi:hypothetical protein [Camelimonas lactis]|uniref:Peptidase n=1 Tax=Camelimonas lactis TaxID=659006 RepID=A0A4R2GWJ4_9HYPH|nr:hypothetical protein [Camelimonas lactis]TCO15216.1 hypothetical protein EV666_102194 [Camelimonas lactis]
MTGTTKRIEVFRPGTFTPMSGASVTMTAEDLRGIAAAYDPAVYETPAVVGHPKTEDAAYGWAKAFSYDEASQRLVADVGDIAPAFGEAVAAKRYKNISLSLFAPGAPNNPKPGAWYPKHIGFLGAVAPAVSGLKPVSFATDDGALTFEFGDPANWLNEQQRPANSPTTEQTMTDAEKRQKELDAREAEVRKREALLQHDQNVAFAEGLIKEGKLIAASQPRVVALLDTLEAQPAAAAGTVSFAEGDAQITQSPADAVRAILADQPVVVSFGEFAGRQPAEAQATVSFASPDGRAVDATGLARLAKIEAWQKQNPGATFEQAVAAVS